MKVIVLCSNGEKFEYEDVAKLSTHISGQYPDWSVADPKTVVINTDLFGLVIEPDED